MKFLLADGVEFVPGMIVYACFNLMEGVKTIDTAGAKVFEAEDGHVTFTLFPWYVTRLSDLYSSPEAAKQARIQGLKKLLAQVKRKIVRHKAELARIEGLLNEE